MRYLAKFTKESNIKFVSHLDLMRTIQRMIRRSDLPFKYSQGYNPHVILSIAQPLSVGMYSKGEYMDIGFIEKIDTEYAKKKLNESAPNGIKILNIVKTKEKIGEKKTPRSMALIEAASYKLKIKYIDDEKIMCSMRELMNKEEWNTTKRSKKKTVREINIKPMIQKIEYDIYSGYLNIDTLLNSGSKENLSPKLLGEYLRNNLKGVNKEGFIDIERQDMYTYKEQDMVTLDEYLRE